MIYPALVAISGASVLVTGVPSLLSFHVAPVVGDMVLQQHPQPAAEEVARSRHIVIEQRRPAAAGQDGLMSVMCTSEALQPALIPILFVSTDEGRVGRSSQRVVSRGNLNVTCVASFTTLRPPAASVLLDEAFAVKLSVIEAAPPSVVPLHCDPGLTLLSPPPVLMPLGGSGLYEGVFVLMCRFDSLLSI